MKETIPFFAVCIPAKTRLSISIFTAQQRQLMVAEGQLLAGMNVARLQEKLQMRGIAISGLGGRVRACTHLDVTPAMIEEAVSEIRTALKAA